MRPSAVSRPRASEFRDESRPHPSPCRIDQVELADSPEVSFWEIPNCEAINGFQRGAAKTVSTMQNAKSLTDTVFHSTMLRHFVPQ